MAMSPESLQERVLQQPFEPFRVCLSDGATSTFGSRK